jgi:hypothetical protein
MKPLMPHPLVSSRNRQQLLPPALMRRDPALQKKLSNQNRNEQEEGEIFPGGQQNMAVSFTNHFAYLKASYVAPKQRR